jgi:hypothetical protein
MHKISVVLLTLFVLLTSVHAADKIRIGYPAPLGHFITLPLAQKKGFFREEGIEAELVQIRGPADRFHGTYPPNINEGTHPISVKGPTQYQVVPFE